MTYTCEKIVPEESYNYKITRREEIIIKSHDEPERMDWDKAMEKFGPNGTDPIWRLPTEDELKMIYDNRDNINGLNTSGSASYYWSSSEYNSHYAWSRRFSDGHHNSHSKGFQFSVRCVRRDERRPRKKKGAETMEELNDTPVFDNIKAA